MAKTIQVNKWHFNRISKR